MNRVGLLLSLVPLVMWGTGDYLASKASRLVNTFSVNYAFAVYSLPAPIIICIFKGFPPLEATLYAKYFLAALLVSIGFLAMVKGFSKGTVGIVAPLANAYAIITLFFLAIFFNEPVKQTQIIAVVMIVLGVALISYQNGKKKVHATSYSVKYGITAMLSFGMGFALIAKFSSESTWYGNQFILAVTGTIIGLALLIYYGKKQKRLLLSGLTNKFNIVGGLIGSLGILGLFAALSTGTSTVLVAAIASGAPLVTSLLAYKFDHERLHYQQRIGTFVIVASVVYVNILNR